MKDTLRRNAVQKAKAPAPAKALSQAKAPTPAQVAGKQLAEQIIAKATAAAQVILAQVKAATAPKLSTLDTKMMALLTGSWKSSSVDNRMVELAAAEANRISR